MGWVASERGSADGSISIILKVLLNSGGLESIGTEKTVQTDLEGTLPVPQRCCSPSPSVNSSFLNNGNKNSEYSHGVHHAPDCF